MAYVDVLVLAAPLRPARESSNCSNEHDVEDEPLVLWEIRLYLALADGREEIAEAITSEFHVRRLRGLIC